MANSQHSVCLKCHRPLKNPLSVEIGMGPICRLTNKRKNMNKESLFSQRSSFSWGFLRPTNPKFIKHIIWILDHDKGKSVTNDIDNVLFDINKEVIDITDGDKNITDFLVMACDSVKVWDGVTPIHTGTGRDGMHFTAGFFSIHKQDREEAANKLWDMRGRAPKEKKEEALAEVSGTEADSNLIEE